MPAPVHTQLLKTLASTSLRLEDPSLRSSLAAIKAYLVGPVLTALGWDLTDPQQVRHGDWGEGKGFFPHYTLYGNGGPEVGIQVYELLHNDYDDRMILRFAKATKLESYVITDGNCYNCIGVSPGFDMVYTEPMWSVRLWRTDHDAAAEVLMSISRAVLEADDPETEPPPRSIRARVMDEVLNLVVAPETGALVRLQGKLPYLTEMQITAAVKRARLALSLTRDADVEENADLEEDADGRDGPHR